MFRYLFLFLFISTSTLAQQKDKEQIFSIMEQQENCWNKADIDCFMEGYWKSDSLKFIGSNGITYGWQQTLANYQKKYHNSAQMGKLKFDILYTEKLSSTSFYVIGKWFLKREVGDVGGHFTLLWKKIDGEWKITADHSS